MSLPKEQVAKKWTSQEALEIIGIILNKTCGTDITLIAPTAHLVEDLGVDSLGMLEAVIESEEVFDVTIDAGELSPQLTINDLIDVLRSKDVIA